MITYVHSNQIIKRLCIVLGFPGIAVFVLWKGIVPIDYNPLVLFMVFVVIGIRVCISIKNNQWPLQKTGFHRSNLTEGTVYYMALVGIGVICFFCAHLVVPVRDQLVSWKFFVSVLVCTGMQQFLFSGYLIKEMRDIFSSRWVVCTIVVIFFTVAHVFFSRPEVILPATCLFSIILTPLYYSHPNYLLAWLTHSIFNALAIYTKMFTPIWV